jgi:hypothetical protein
VARAVTPASDGSPGGSAVRPERGSRWGATGLPYCRPAAAVAGTPSSRSLPPARVNPKLLGAGARADTDSDTGSGTAGGCRRLTPTTTSDNPASSRPPRSASAATVAPHPSYGPCASVSPLTGSTTNTRTAGNGRPHTAARSARKNGRQTFADHLHPAHRPAPDRRNHPTGPTRRSGDHRHQHGSPTREADARRSRESQAPGPLRPRAPSLMIGSITDPDHR